MSETTNGELLVKIRKLEEENEKLKKRIASYELFSPARAYYAAQRMLNQQIDVIKDFNVEDEIKKNPKEDKVYDRVMDIFSSLTQNASKINNLFTELSLSKDEVKDTKPRPIYTPESMADELGGIAGQKS